MDRRDRSCPTRSRPPGRAIFLPRGDLPDVLDDLAPDGVEAVVEVDGRVAVGGVEFEPVADLGAGFERRPPRSVRPNSSPWK